MSTTATLDDLRTRIESHYTFLFLRTWEEERWAEALRDLAEEAGLNFVAWSATAGADPPFAENGGDQSRDADPVASFLKQVAAAPADQLFLLKDFHPWLADATVVRRLRDLRAQLAEQNKTLLLMGPVTEVPLELVKDASIVELPLPGIEEMRDELYAALEQCQSVGTAPAEITPDQEEHLIKAVLGLTAQESRRALIRSLRGREAVDEDVYAAVVAEKRHMVQGSDLLEFFDLEEGLADIGGLEGLKDWVQQRAQSFTTDAQRRGISTPKGVLLLGVQGCGKSLSARAIARLLGFPLVRMDLGNLLTSARGSSEHNLRDVLRVMEMIAPSVLWLEELDKALSGYDEEGGDATMSRIVGRFLTWMQEHTAPVFVVATANNVQHLPPEMLRRGRFDELFFVDLPNYHERKQIFEIHLEKRNWNPEKFDIGNLASNTEGYSGAEIETIVNSAIIESYSDGRMLTEKDLEDAREATVPLSVTMEEQIFSLREWARSRCRPATPESRVMQVMEEEERRGEANVADGSGADYVPEWQQMAEHGQVSAAIIEYVRHRDAVDFHSLQTDFAKYTETVGEFGLSLKSDPKIVIWTRLTQELCDLISGYLASKRLYLNPASGEVYEQAGRTLKLPVIDKLPEERIEKPVWLPTVLRLVPAPGAGSRFGRVARIRLK